MADLISRQDAIDINSYYHGQMPNEVNYEIYKKLMQLPSAQPEMIREIRKWINSSNRGNADYFIVDKIEEIINKYE